MQVEEGRCLVTLVVEEDKDMNKILVVTRRGTRLMLGVDCLLQLPPLVDGGGRDWLLQEAGGQRGQPAEEGFQY